MLVFLSCIK